MRTRMLSCYKGEAEVSFTPFQYISSLCCTIPNARFTLRRAAKRGEKAGCIWSESKPEKVCLSVILAKNSFLFRLFV